MTYTYAIAEVSPATFNEILQILQNAGYLDSINETSDGPVLDMRGIALRQALEPKNSDPLKVFAQLIAHIAEQIDNANQNGEDTSNLTPRQLIDELIEHGALDEDVDYNLAISAVHYARKNRVAPSTF